MRPCFHKRKSRFSTVVACAVIAGLIVPVVHAVPQAEAVDSGIVSGFVFQDYDSDGVYDDTVVAGEATDVPIAGISVQVVDSTGALVATAVTGADGRYEIDAAGASSSEVRVEFVSPTEGPLAALRPSFDGPDSGTSVQFVTLPATDVNLGMLYADEYCQANPNIAVSRLCAGVGNPTTPSVLVTRYDGGPYTTAQGFNNVYSNWSATRAGTKSDTGSILGMAWDPVSRRVFNSAYIRRMAETYEIGGRPVPGALFVTSPSGTTAAEGTGGSTSFFVDLETLMAGDQFSNSNPAGPGFIPTNADRKIQFAIDGTIDGGADNDGVDSDLVAGQVGVYEEVGKAGIGDIETDGSGRLWVVSLYTKELYELTLPPDGSVPSSMTSLGDITSDVTCTNGEGRPFSVTHYRGSLYLGVVCDGSGDFSAASPGAVTDANLSFTIRRYDLATQAWSNFFGPHPLNASGMIFKGQADGVSSSLPTSMLWNSWTDLWVTTGEYPQIFGTRPVPMLTGIEFDSDGSMILGFRDRTGDQNALNEQETPVGTSHFYPTLASGDIYRVCRVGTGFTGADYAFEGTSPDCQQTAGGTNGTEYYTGDKYFSFHFETSVGMIEQVPGFPEVLLNAYDPYDGDGSGATFYSGGTRYLRNAIGTHDGVFPNAGGGTLFFAWSGNAANPNAEGGFLKTNGMSDVEALCDQAPIQIGNRVWIDDNNNGLQDPGEVPVAGATVRLYDSSEVLVGTAITDEEGQYLFSSMVTEPADGGVDPDAIGGGVTSFEAFSIRMDNPADYRPGGPLHGYELTEQDAITADVETVDYDVVDNDAVAVGDGVVTGFGLYPSIEVDPLEPGANDHSFDFGFVLMPLVGMGDYTWIDVNRDGVQGADEPVLAGVTVELLDSTGAQVLDGDANPVTAITDADGHYFFDGLFPGEYAARFVLPEGYVFTIASSSAGTSATDSNPDPLTGVTPVFTIAGEEFEDTVVDTDPATEAVFVNPTIDAGVVPLVAMGDYTWIDWDKDGVQGADEPVLPGVTVTLFADDGVTPVFDVDGNAATAVTDANGYYFIDALLPGDYVALFELPDGYVFTMASSDVGTSATDSNPDPSTGITPVFAIEPLVVGDTVADVDPDTRAVFVNPTIDAGVIPLVAMGDYTWFDENGDGIQGADEPVLPGVTVTLFADDGVTPVFDVDGNAATAVTDDNGYYFIDALLPGTYIAQFALPEDLEGYTFTVGQSGDDVAVDSNPDRYTGFTDPFVIAPTVDGDTTEDVDPLTRALFVNPTIDAGVVPVVAVGNYVWMDVNRDGIQDPDEQPIAGVEVELLNPDQTPALDAGGLPVSPVFTDEQGLYVIDNLAPGDYRIRFTAPVGFAATVLGAGGDNDSNIDPEGLTDVFTINPLAEDDTREVVDGDAVTTALLINPTIDAGYVPLVGMGDYVWIDSNRDGLQGADEPALGGVEVTLELPDGSEATDHEGNPATAVTNDEGLYFIDGLFPGDYVARFVIPVGYEFTSARTGDDAADSNPDPSADDPLVGRTPVFTITAAVGDGVVVDTDEATVALFANLTIDAGVVEVGPPPASIPPDTTPAVTHPRLPTTGLTSGALLGLGLGLLMLGLGLMARSRQRSAITAAAVGGSPRCD